MMSTKYHRINKKLKLDPESFESDHEINKVIFLFNIIEQIK